MSLNKVDMEFEKEKLENTVIWIDEELEKIELEDNKLKVSIEGVRKATKGRYCEELANYDKVYKIIHKNLEKYKEAKLQPYFGRIDFRQYKGKKESFYIGKSGLGDFTNGEEKVVDWRAPLAELYYSGTSGESYYIAPEGIISGELSLKRKFIIKNGELLDAFDEGIDEIILKQGNEEGSALVDEFLRINLEESTGSKLKEVAATIQKEQNQIIRAAKNKPLIIQGTAGSGKTTVALHRLAYLLYKYKGKLQGKDILVLAPNKLFLDYISEVLPELGIDDVKQCTFEDIAVKLTGIKEKVITKDKNLAKIMELGEERNSLTIESCKVKSSIAFKKFIDRYLLFLEQEDIKIEDIKVKEHTLFNKEEIKRLYQKDMANLPINQRKKEIKRYLSLKINEKVKSILDKIDFTCDYMVSREKKNSEDTLDRRLRLTELYDQRDERKQDIIKNTKIFFDEYFENWMHHGAKGTYFEMFLNRNYFQAINNGLISEELFEYIYKEIISNNDNGIIDCYDLYPLMYLKLRIEGISDKDKYKHITIDEAQDYSILQYEVLKAMCNNNSITALGDIAQGIYYYQGNSNFETIINEVFNCDTEYVTLSQSYRSTIEIINFANNVLKKQNINIKPAIPVLRHGKSPMVVYFEKDNEFVEEIENIQASIHKEGKNTIAIIGRNYDECKKINEILKKHSKDKWELVKESDKKIKSQRVIIPCYMTKGLEFDCTILYNCNDDNYKERELDKKLLYVCLTRALHLEYIFYKEKKSRLLNM